MNIPNNILLVSGPVILQDDRVLLNKKSGGHWAFPGGKTEPTDQNLEATAIREAKEELNIDITILRPLNTLVFERTDTPGLVIAAHYLAEYEGDITKNNETEDWQWFHIHELPPDDVLAPNVKDVIYSYLEEAK